MVRALYRHRSRPKNTPSALQCQREQETSPQLHTADTKSKRHTCDAPAGLAAAFTAGPSARPKAHSTVAPYTRLKPSEDSTWKPETGRGPRDRTELEQLQYPFSWALLRDATLRAPASCAVVQKRAREGRNPIRLKQNSPRRPPNHTRNEAKHTWGYPEEGPIPTLRPPSPTADKVHGSGVFRFVLFLSFFVVGKR